MSHKTDLYSLDMKQHKKRLELHESQSPIFSNYYPLLSFSSLNQCWPCAPATGRTDTRIPNAYTSCQLTERKAISIFTAFLPINSSLRSSGWNVAAYSS